MNERCLGALVLLAREERVLSYCEENPNSFVKVRDFFTHSDFNLLQTVKVIRIRVILKFGLLTQVIEIAKTYTIARLLNHEMLLYIALICNKGNWDCSRLRFDVLDCALANF